MAEVFGKYQLLAKLGSGGMAEVWLARSSSIGGFEKLLAIKRMHADLSNNPDFVSMFIDEAKLTVSLSHPNIVQIFDFGQVDEDYFMAMEYVEGFDLSTIARRARNTGKPLPVDLAVYILRGVCDGLAYAHTRGERGGLGGAIIHRDVSPQNVLVSFDGHVKVSDFGIARAASWADKPASEFIGKVAYSSPEQSRGEKVGPETDLWSASVILHELLTNQRLFLRSNDALTLEAVQHADIPRPRALNAEVPEELDAVVMAGLARDPAERTATARDQARALGEILRDHYRGANEYRLQDEISAMWSHQLPRASAAVRAQRPRSIEREAAAEITQPLGEDTAAQVARVARETAARAPTDPGPGRVPAPGPPPLEAGKSLDLEPELAARRADGPDLRAEIERLQRRFSVEPNLWTLVDLGRALMRAGQRPAAMGAYKLAAAKFAQSGLLIQACCIYRLVIDEVGPSPQLKEEISRLRGLQAVSDDELLTEVLRGQDESTDFTQCPHELFAPSHPVRDGDAVFAPSPILSSLNGEQLAGLVLAVQLRAYGQGDKIIREGMSGDAFFMIGRGRVVVSATGFKGRLIYVTSLADGDCFGEQSFFTGEPRSATVEAIEEVLVLEVSRSVLNRVMVEFPEVRESLRRFYKDRLAESLLAKSPLFAPLSIATRRLFAQQFSFESYAPGDLIIREGDRSDAFYALQSGRVLVYTGPESSPIRLAELGAGEVFGEIAALEGHSRTASVRAMSECEILRLEGSELNALLDRNDEVRRMMEDKMEARAQARLKKIIESR